jgi:NAD(P)-dependent dehydrogenase (short-subunit alcohol dehydrogenase family)
MSLSFKGQNILIFGGSNGVGLHLAHRLVETGAKVIIVCKSSKNIKKVESLLNKNSYKIVINDCYKFNNTKLHKVCKSFFNSRLDHLISFLGTGKVNFEMPKKLNEWKDVFNKNFFVNVNLVNEFSDYIIKKNFSSSIILTAAIAGIERVRAPMTYSIAKTSLIAYTNHLSEHMLKKKIRVFSVSPGNIFFKGGRWEEIQKGNKKNIDKFIKNNVGFKRFGTPEEIATVYLNLMHQSNSFMTGNNLIVDGLQSKKIL